MRQRTKLLGSIKPAFEALPAVHISVIARILQALILSLTAALGD